MNIKYMREGRGLCKVCARELDVVVPWIGRPGGAGPVTVGLEPMRWGPSNHPLIARHLNRIEEYTSKGAKPAGFCPGSFGEFNPVPTPDLTRAKKRR